MMRQHRLTLLPGGASRELPEGTPLVDALSDMGVLLRTPCGGKGICGKCGVQITEGAPPRTSADDRFFPDRPHQRLACRVSVGGDMTVRAPEPVSVPRWGRALPSRLNEPAVAIDIGTTTVQVSLVERPGGETYPLGSFLNPQRRHGHDVITRIAASADPLVHASLVRVIRHAVASAVQTALHGRTVDAEPTGLLVVSGNTTMTHLFFGLDVRPLGVFPYTAGELDYEGMTLPEGLPASTRVAALPSASAFLGGDLVGGLALTEETCAGRRVFFIDIGTNGEMFLRDRRGVAYAASCAMGPALEGMNISSGMTADEGAINHFTVSGGALVPEVIGGTEPVGVCGTGIIDALAIMLREGAVRGNGAFDRAAVGASGLFAGRLDTTNGVLSCRLAGNVALSQKDIRNIQLAKGASLAAARILLREASCRAEEVELVMIAGAFGENLDIDNFRSLGFLPDFPDAEYRFMGNTSLAAAERACVDPAFIERCRALRDSLAVVELTSRGDFNDLFIECLNFH